MKGYRHICAVLVLLLGCGRQTPAPEAAPTARPAPATDPWTVITEDAVRGVADPTLSAIVADHWVGGLRRNPTGLLSLGFRELWDGSLGEVGAEAEATARAERDALIARLDAVDPATLSPGDRTTWTLLGHELRTSQRMDPCEERLWQVSAWRNPLATYTSLARDAAVADPLAGERFLVAMSQMPAAIAVRRADLSEGVATGQVASRLSVERTLEMIDAELARPAEEWGLMVALSEGSWSDAAARDAFLARATEALQTQLRPAIEAYAATLRDTVLPAAREGENVGAIGLPQGEACYAGAIEHFTTLPLTPEELHQAGLDELDVIHEEMATLGMRELGTTDRAELFAKLREDPALHFTTREEVRDAAEQALRDAEAAVPDWFAVTPRTPCVVTEVPDIEAPYTYIAYYDPPPAGGAEPGQYYINTWEPTSRPRFSSRALAFHESVPGHHFQIARSVELTDVPAFRRHASGLGVFVEGWALYTERLADEMELYPSDLDRLGMLTFDAWRAARLVVDTGLHAKGWSRQEAIDFMDESTGLAHNNVVNEVDRYLQWPGQALGYKTGQMEILALREEAREALGADFDIRGFHEAVLGAGAVTLPLLRERVGAWIAAGGGAP